MGLSLELTYNGGKEDVVFNVEAAAVVVASAGNIKMWIGDNLMSFAPPAVILQVPQVTVHNALLTCAEKIREIVPGYPTAQVQTAAHGSPAAATSSYVTFQGAGAPAGLTEDEVLVIYEQTYAGNQPHASQIFAGQLRKLWERIIEATK